MAGRYSLRELGPEDEALKGVFQLLVELCYVAPDESISEVPEQRVGLSTGMALLTGLRMRLGDGLEEELGFALELALGVDAEGLVDLVVGRPGAKLLSLDYGPSLLHQAIEGIVVLARGLITGSTVVLDFGTESRSQVI